MDTARRARLPAGAGLVAAVAVLIAALAGLSEVGAVGGSATRGWPSGQAPPAGDLPGWRQVFVDDFDRSELGADWTAYSGAPGGDPVSWWDPGHVEVGGSLLTLHGQQENGRWVTGGVSNWPVTLTYGKWLVRARMDPGDEITYAFLLWPQADVWPPEIDFLEDWGGDRSQASAFLHYVTDTGRDKAQHGVSADFTEWHTVGVEWRPGTVTFTLDGQDWGTMTGPQVPDIPMWLALQTQAGGCDRRDGADATGCPVAGQPERTDVQVDWVAVYAPDGG